MAARFLHEYLDSTLDADGSSVLDGSVAKQRDPDLRRRTLITGAATLAAAVTVVRPTALFDLVGLAFNTIGNNSASGTVPPAAAAVDGSSLRLIAAVAFPAFAALTYRRRQRWIDSDLPGVGAVTVQDIFVELLERNGTPARFVDGSRVPPTHLDPDGRYHFAGLTAARRYAIRFHSIGGEQVDVRSRRARTSTLPVEQAETVEVTPAAEVIATPAARRSRPKSPPSAFPTDLEQRWVTAVADVDRVRVEISRICGEPIAALEHALLADPTGPCVRELDEALATSAKISSKNYPKRHPERAVEFISSVDRAIRAWRDAEYEARQAGVGYLARNDDERKALDKAMRLVRKALDSTVGPEERSAFLAGAWRLIEPMSVDRTIPASFVAIAAAA